MLWCACSSLELHFNALGHASGNIRYLHFRHIDALWFAPTSLRLSDGPTLHGANDQEAHIGTWHRELPITILLVPVFITLLLYPDGPMVLFGPTFILLIVGTLIIRLKPPPKPPEIWEEMPEEEKPWLVEESTNA